MHGGLVHFLLLKLSLRHDYHQTFLKCNIDDCNISVRVCRRTIFRNVRIWSAYDAAIPSDGNSTTLCGRLRSKTFSLVVWDFVLSAFRIVCRHLVFLCSSQDCGSKKILLCSLGGAVPVRFLHNHSLVA